MTRSAMPARTTELRRAAIAPGSKRSGGGVALPPVSTRRKKLNRALAAVVAEKRRTVRDCQAQPMIRALLVVTTDEADRRTLVAALQSCRLHAPEVPHHMLKRSRGTDATLVDAANIVLICRSCDLFTEAEVRLSTAAGLLVPSHERAS